MRYQYKSNPIEPEPAFPDVDEAWHPILSVRLVQVKRHGVGNRFAAWVDTGCPYTYFHGDVGRAIGLKIENGIQSRLSGIVGGAKVAVFFHDVGVIVDQHMIEIRAAFCDSLAVPGVLGRNGFFDNFRVTFDHSVFPPCFEIDRIKRD